MGTGTDRASEIDGATTVLLLAPNVQDRSMDACARALRGRSGRLDRVVAVTVTGSAADWLSMWDRTSTGEPKPVTCVDVDGDTRSAASVSSAPSGAVERVSDPTDLESLGRRISDVVQRADETDDRVGIAIHSLTGMLQHVDDQTAFKFVYTLGEVIRRVEGTAFFHLDPAAHDQETIETFRIVCDAVVHADRGRSGFHRGQ
ncbi:DUF7504 family protein [Halosimplex salinum]|uniref:DUF7504 family protein n=1 Tax=Halosimplex salinum TaxID=1710538 RepID=UPI000F4824BA|nr:hypothetical protein [Halosimplex salinum]